MTRSPQPSTPRPRPLLGLVALTAVALLGAAGCGVSGENGAARITTGSASGASLQRAASSTAEVRTMRVASTVAVSGSGSLDATVESTGEFDREANRSRMVLETGDLLGLVPGGEGGAEGDGAGSTEIVVDGTTIYVRSPLFGALAQDGKPWLKTDAGSLPLGAGGLGGAQSDPAGILELFEGAGDEVEDLGRAEVRGVPTTHYRTDLELDELLARASGPAAAELEERLRSLGAGDLPTMPAQAWVDDEGRVRRVELAFTPGAGAPGLDGGAVTMEITVELYDFDEPVDIAVPSADQVGELDPSVLFGGGN